MSVAAMSRELLRPLLPFLPGADAHRAEVAGCPGRPAGQPPVSAPAHVVLLCDDRAELAEPLRRAFPAPA
jgi:hypothetical protein